MMMSERREASEPYLLKDKGRRCVSLGGAHLAGSAELSIEQIFRIPIAPVVGADASVHRPPTRQMTDLSRPTGLWTAA